MTANNSANKTVIAGNGVQTVFAFGFIAVDPSDITVILTDSSGNQTQLAAAQYAIALNPAGPGQIWSIGGTVTFPLAGSPAPMGSSITILRELPLTQLVALSNQGNEFPSAVETALDLLEMQIQQISELFQRALVAPVVDPATPLPLPAAAQRANQALIFDTGGNPTAGALPASGVISAPMQPVVNAATLAAARAALGLGTIAAENIGGAGSGISDDGAGNVRVSSVTVPVAVSQSPTINSHYNRFIATGPINFSLARANNLFNGYGFWVEVVSGTVTFIPSAADSINSGASGAALTIDAPASVFITTNAQAAGTWYADITPGAALSGNSVQKSASYSVQTIDNGLTHTVIGSNSIMATVGAPAGYPASFKLKWINNSSRGLLLNISGIAPFYLWPTQSAELESTGSVWDITPRFQRYAPATPVILNVDPAGSDSSDGLGTGSGAFLTPQHAFNVLKGNVDVSSGEPTIQLATGTYSVGSGLILTYALTGGNQFALTGDVAAPGSCKLQCAPGSVCIFGRDGTGTCTVTGVDFSTTGSGSIGISCSQFYQIDFGNVQFDNFPLGNHIAIVDLGSMDIVGNYTIAGSAANHIFMSGQSKLNYGSFTVNLSNALTFTTFLNVNALSWVNAGGVPLSLIGPGAASGSAGQRFSVTQNSVVNSAGTTFPGTGSGITASGSIFN